MGLSQVSSESIEGLTVDVLREGDIRCRALDKLALASVTFTSRTPFSAGSVLLVRSDIATLKDVTIFLRSSSSAAAKQDFGAEVEAEVLETKG